MGATIALALRILAYILAVIGLIFLLGLILPVLPGDALTSIAFMFAAYVLIALA